MEFSYRHKRQITIWIIVLFMVLIADRLLNGMMLTQLRPSFFVNRMDVFTWLLMYTGVHSWLLNNPAAWLIFDSLFIVFPLIYLAVFFFRPAIAIFIGLLWLIFNWLYVQCYTLYASNSIEAHLAWLLLPVLFTTTTQKGFYLVFRFMRFFFLWFLVSAGLWKIWQHGIFNYDQMSAILYMQHKDFLATSPESWLSKLYYWLIRHSLIGYCLYAGSAVIELAFAIGFFTRRFDRLLIVLYFSFFIMDVLIMRIKYWELAPFILTLCYSTLIVPASYPGFRSSGKRLA